jgi:ABC-type multidrug transport system fused ATPase/permease subunit
MNRIMDNIEKIKKIENELKKKEKQIARIEKIVAKFETKVLGVFGFFGFLFSFFVPAFIVVTLVPLLSMTLHIAIFVVFFIIGFITPLAIHHSYLNGNKKYKRVKKIYSKLKQKRSLLLKEKEILFNQLSAEDFFNIKERIKNIPLIDEMVHSFETRSQIRTESEILNSTFKKLLNKEVLSREERSGIHKLLELYEKEKDTYINQTREERIQNILKTKEDIVNIENE